MSDTKNIQLGTCQVIYNGVDLGYTQGGVDVSVTTDTHKVNVDQFGKSTVNEIIMGRDISVKCPLAETTLQNLVAIMPGATLSAPDANGNVSVSVETGVGTSLLDLAQTLVLHPSERAKTDQSMDVVIPKAATAGAIKFTFKLDTERLYDVTFTGYPDPTTNILFQIGVAVAAADAVEA